MIFLLQKKDAGRKKEDDEGKITEEGGRWCDIDYVKIQLKSNDTWNAFDQVYQVYTENV